MTTVIMIAAATVAACGPAPTDPDQRRQLVVQAASSLTDVFGEIETRLERADPGLDIILNLAGSQTLATQITQGVPADVFASADARQMAVVSGAGLVWDTPRTFATNELAIAVAPGNPTGIDGLADLAREDVVVVLADPAVPAGRFARQALDKAEVTLSPESFEQDVRAVLSRVALDEADAGIVYVTDIVGQAVQAVDIPQRHNVAATYPIAVLAGAPNAKDAEMFTDYVLSTEGQTLLRRFGFGPP